MRSTPEYHIVGGRYAGVLGPLACATVLVRGTLHQAGPEATLRTAWLALWAFASLGFVVGQLAEWMVTEGVESRFAAEWNASRADRPAATHPARPQGGK